MKIAKTTSSISFPVIIEGTIYTKVLEHFQLNEAWLRQQLLQQDVASSKDVFFASINKKLELQITLKNETEIDVPFIRH